MILSATFDAFVPANLTAFLASTKVQPNFISFDALNSIIPLDGASKASYEYAQRMLPKIGFLHVLRTYFYALVILFNGFPSGTPGVPQITFQELNTRLYHAAILHDLGWTPGPDSIAPPLLDAHQVGDIVQSIMVHTSEFGIGEASAVESLLSLGANFDVGGFDFLGGATESVFNRTTVQQIEKAFPRGNLGTYLGRPLLDSIPDGPLA
ncbi:hypothetical protein C8J57DRAFT_1397440 [Mycena rebaudengoi]|nr:hypothetical protein C8J57DRAFT_1397440 [Mycena rebaudengoi]